MIAAIRGTVRQAEGNQLVLEVGPVDVRVLAPQPTVARLRPGQAATLATHLSLSLRSEQAVLYGFETEAERQAFEALISVAGVGPRAALALLSTLDLQQLRMAIIHGDKARLTQAPGVGPRAAARLVAELKDRFAPLVPAPEGDGTEARTSALEALVALGYSVGLARRALDAVGVSGPTEVVVREALKYLDETRD